MILKTKQQVWIRFVVVFCVFILLLGALSVFALMGVIERADEENARLLLQEELAEPAVLPNSPFAVTTKQSEFEWDYERDDDHEHEHEEWFERRDVLRGSLWLRYARGPSGEWVQTFDRIDNLSGRLLPALERWMPDEPDLRRFAVRDSLQFIVAAAPTENGWLYVGVEVSRSRELWEKAAWVTMAVVLFFALLGSGLAWWSTRSAMVPVEEAMTRQAQFATNASHEFRTPLAIMRTTLDCLQAEPEIQASPQYVAWLNGLQEEVERMTALIERLLAMARFEEGSALQLQTVKVADIVHSVCGRMQRFADEKNIQLRVEGDAALHASVDRLLIEQLLMILLDNAIKFSPSGSAVRCVWEDAAPRGLSLSVSDQGPGIPPDMIPQLFERFYTGDAARVRQSGFGIGLSIAAAIVSAHCGRIEVESEQQKGSTFRLVLPDVRSLK